MPRRRQPRQIWRITRLRIWDRDGKRCVHCHKPLALNECHIDHIRSGKLGSNADSNLRTLCKVCHALRLDHRHRGLLFKLLSQGLLPENWRELVWE